MKSLANHGHHDIGTQLDNDDDAMQTTPTMVRLEDLREELHRDNDDVRTTFLQTNLISDGFVTALKTDPNLINPWGVSFGPTSPFWFSDNGAGLSSVDRVVGNVVTLNVRPPVTMPSATPGGKPAAPTGQVFNAFQAAGAFKLSNGTAATFIFATEDGTIAGWNAAAGNKALLAVNKSQDATAGDATLGLGAVYKGLAIAQTASGPMLYAANFRHGTVDVFDQTFNQVMSFTDPHLPPGYAPFNVQVLNGNLYVTYALQDATKHDDVGGAGHGFVDQFDLQGHLVERIASRGPLDSPWGLAIAPASFGSFAGDLLVGNFRDGTIDAFDLRDHDPDFVGKLLGADGKPLVIGDLWALTTGNGGSAGDPNALYFTAGLQNEAHGLFGSLTPNSAAFASGTMHI